MVISNLADVHSVLTELAYSSELHPESVRVMMGKFPVIVTINSRGELVISCQVALLGSIQEDRLTEFAFAALEANNRLSPFAISIITEDHKDICLEDHSSESVESDEYPIVLVDNIPLGDFSKDELSKSFGSLRAALLGCRSVLMAGVHDPIGV